MQPLFKLSVATIKAIEGSVTTDAQRTGAPKLAEQLKEFFNDLSRQLNTLGGSIVDSPTETAERLRKTNALSGLTGILRIGMQIRIMPLLGFAPHTEVPGSLSEYPAFIKKFEILDQNTVDTLKNFVAALDRIDFTGLDKVIADILNTSLITRFIPMGTVLSRVKSELKITGEHNIQAESFSVLIKKALGKFIVAPLQAKIAEKELWLATLAQEEQQKKKMADASSTSELLQQIDRDITTAQTMIQENKDATRAVADLQKRIADMKAIVKGRLKAESAAYAADKAQLTASSQELLQIKSSGNAQEAKDSERKIISKIASMNDHFKLGLTSGFFDNWRKSMEPAELPAKKSGWFSWLSSIANFFSSRSKTVAAIIPVDYLGQALEAINKRARSLAPPLTKNLEAQRELDKFAKQAATLSVLSDVKKQLETLSILKEELVRLSKIIKENESSWHNYFASDSEIQASVKSQKDIQALLKEHEKLHKFFRTVDVATLTKETLEEKRGSLKQLSNATQAQSKKLDSSSSSRFTG